MLEGYLEAERDIQNNSNRVFTIKINNVKSDRANFPTLEEELSMKLRYGQGTIVKRVKQNKKGIYTFYQGCIQHNNEKYYVTAKTKVECFNKLRDIRNELTNNIKKPKAKVLTFGIWLDRWYKEYKADVLKPNSLSNIRVVMNKHITDEFKNKDIKKILSIDIQTCLNQIETPRQKFEALKTIRNALKYAKLNGYIKEAIWEGVILKKHVYKKAKALSRQEQELLIFSANTDLMNCIVGYLWTGCRRNELLAIKKSDCDLIKSTITIRGTKTKTSYRTIPLFKPLRDFIINTIDDNGYVFKCAQINHKYKALCDSLNFVGFTIHSLRHTFATNCLEKGVNVKTIQHWLGHSRMSTTTDIYTHLSIEQENIDACKMDSKDK